MNMNNRQMMDALYKVNELRALNSKEDEFSLGQLTVAASIVRCKSCRSYGRDSENMGECAMEMQLIGLGEDFFCGYGQRKDKKK